MTSPDQITEAVEWVREFNIALRLYAEHGGPLIGQPGALEAANAIDALLHSHAPGIGSALDRRPMYERLIEKLPTYDPTWPDEWRDLWMAWADTFMKAALSSAKLSEAPAEHRDEPKPCSAAATKAQSPAGKGRG